MTAPDADPTEPHLDLETPLDMTRDSAGIVRADEDDDLEEET